MNDMNDMNDMNVLPVPRRLKTPPSKIVIRLLAFVSSVVQSLLPGYCLMIRLGQFDVLPLVLLVR